MALAGQVSSQEEGPMEGVLVSAKAANSTITVTVVSDEHGHYSFPGKIWSRDNTPSQFAPPDTTWMIRERLP